MPNFAPPQPRIKPTPQPWRNSFLHRLMLATLIRQMENRLLAENSATQTLERWLQEHAMFGPNETLRAERESNTSPPCPPELLAALDMPAPHNGHALRYRKIRLMGQNHIYSEAENWFVPARLTTSMTETLEQTDTPFGRVVAPLGFTRQLLRRETLWSPLPNLWEMQPLITHQAQEEAPLALPPYLFRHVALLRTHAGTPFSLVVETYTPQAFAFGPPTSPE